QRPVPAWAVINQIRELFDVRTMPAEFNAVPPEFGLLMLVHPKNLSDETLYAIDQFVMRGGRVLAFIDPNAETESPSPQGPAGPSDIDRLLKSWGVTFINDKIAADLQSARRVNVRHEGQITQVDYVAWNSLDRRNLDTTDAVVADIRDLNVGSAGIIEPAEGATTDFRPLVTTSENSQALDVVKLQGRIDIIGLFRDFQPSGKKLVMAARVTGPVKSAFPDGPPLIGEGEDAEKARTERAKTHLAEAQKPLNAVIVADTDILHEGLWAEIRNVNGEQLLVPYAGNSDFVINAVENLTGGDALLGLRSRGDSKRPFLMVEQIQLEAERKFRAEQEKLAKELQETQKRIEGLTSREGGSGEAILTAEEKTAIAEFRRKMIDIRHDLRNVQHALRKDIDALDAWLKFLNIAAIPLILGFAALVIAIVRRLSRARARPVTE
ncbi:MAG: Gldg family protein, partial [Rhodospirillales bacterium]